MKITNQKLMAIAALVLLVAAYISVETNFIVGGIISTLGCAYFILRAFDKPDKNNKDDKT